MSADESSSVLITGAASGIGDRVARRFARHEWRVGVLDPNQEAVKQLAGELRGAPDVFARGLDLTDENAVCEAVSDFSEHTDGRLDVLLNAASTVRAGRFEQTDLATHREHVDGNLWAVLVATHAAFPLLQNTDGARVITIASASSMYGTPDLASYSASKAGVRAFTQALNLEWAHHDIHVCDVIPPYADAPPGAASAERAAASEGEPTPVRRRLAPNLTADDVADVVEQAVTEDKIHWPVGKQFRWIYRLSDVLPAPLVRLFMRYVSGF